MKIRPLNDWAAIKRLGAQERTPGGVIIPDTAKEKPAEGVIIAIGPGRYQTEKKQGKKEKKFVPTTLKPGQRVIYARYMETEIDLDGEEVVLIREENIYGTVEEEDKLPVKREKPSALVHKGKSEIITVSPQQRAEPRKAPSEKPVKPAKKTAKKKTTPKKTAKKPVAKAKKVAKRSKVKKATKSARKKPLKTKVSKKTPAKKASARTKAKKSLKKKGTSSKKQKKSSAKRKT